MTTFTELKALLAVTPGRIHVEIWKRELASLIAAVEALKVAADDLHMARYFNSEKNARAALKPFGE